MSFFGLNITILSVTLLALFFLSFVLLLLYYGFIFLRVGVYKDKPSQKKEKEPVSVIICAKDQYFNLKEKLFYLLEQEYPVYEVIVINHASQDETEFLLQVFSETYPHLKIVNLQKDINRFSGKKFALAIGIKSAKYDLLLLTDANCLPNSYHWIDKMQAKFESKTQILLGYSAYKAQKSMLGFLIQYENVVNAASCFGFALAHNPYTGCGRNLAYRKSFFFQNKGFISHYRLNSGDDNLFVNKNADKSNTQICLDKETYTISSDKTRFSEWIAGKRRHFETVREYSDNDKFLLSIYPFSVLFFYTAICGLFVLQLDYKFLVSCLVLKIGLQIFCFYKLAKRLDAPKKIFIFSPVFELFFLIFNAIVSLLALKHKKA